VLGGGCQGVCLEGQILKLTKTAMIVPYIFETTTLVTMQWSYQSIHTGACAIHTDLCFQGSECFMFLPYIATL
jgi:hypothetical protein